MLKYLSILWLVLFIMITAWVLVFGKRDRHLSADYLLLSIVSLVALYLGGVL